MTDETKPTNTQAHRLQSAGVYCPTCGALTWDDDEADAGLAVCGSCGKKYDGEDGALR